MAEWAAPLTTLAARVPLSWHAVDRIGDDLRLIARVLRTPAPA
jgi:hypothetical protein